MKKFGLIGHPVGHSMSAVMHAEAFRILDLPHKYELIDVRQEELGEFMKSAGDYSGLNVTIPHKVSVIGYLDELSREAELVGAVNTVKIESRKKGYNTDGIGCVRALEEMDVDAKGMKVLVLGAGGAARAILFQLALEGAKLTIANRTRDKGVELASSVKDKTGINVDAMALDEKSLKAAILEADILINATSVGMHPKGEETPVRKSLLNKDLVVMDLVYNPLETRLLKDAREVGCSTIDGVGMLVHQGAESLRILLGVEPPVAAMRKAVVSKLSD
ncbi:MAG: shikimate dehydrogenase [Candidatus Altiarchaeota archaeon]|nr:shikimate dehydrogenase [Candidatus Altiarchaeota archaeon]